MTSERSLRASSMSWKEPDKERDKHFLEALSDYLGQYSQSFDRNASCLSADDCSFNRERVSSLKVPSESLRVSFLAENDNQTKIEVPVFHGDGICPGEDMANDICMQERALRYLNKGDYEQAIAIFEDLLYIHVDRHGYHSQVVAYDLHYIGTGYIRCGQFDIALPYCDEAVRLRIDLFGANHDCVADSLQKLGIALVSVDEFVSALDAFNRALRIYRNIQEKLMVAKVLFKTGCVYYHISEYVAALAAFEEVLELIVNERACDRQLDVSEIYCNIGFVKLKLKQYGEAVIFLEDSLSIRRASLGGGHVDNLRILDCIAFAQAKLGNASKSIESYIDMTKVQSKVFGENNDSKTQAKMSIIFEKIHRYKDALECRQKVLKMQQNVNERKQTQRKIDQLKQAIKNQESEAQNWI
mmetsp:Transcript_5394/g.7912  ORF Transcript_5394/g.7912 Transcript_5394/m.7912 type:complete len:413 (-) Transcript_5394:1340-2578(-)